MVKAKIKFDGQTLVTYLRNFIKESPQINVLLLMFLNIILKTTSEEHFFLCLCQVTESRTQTLSIMQRIPSQILWNCKPF